MKKVLIGVLLLAAFAISTYLYLNGSVVSKEASVDENAYNILVDNNCSACHSSEASAPFYASIPVIGETVRSDMERGLRHFDISPVLRALEKSQPVSEIALSKIEYTLIHQTMPPIAYQLIHWGSHLTRGERNALFSWIRNERAQKYGEEFPGWMEEPIVPLSKVTDINEEKAALGYLLFHDTRLSGDNTVSCASCHNLETGGVDREQFSIGINDQRGAINAPTVFNALHNVLQFWDGRAVDLQDQAAGPPLNPVEMGSISFDEISDKLRKDPKMRAAFSKIYSSEINQRTITDAIAEFEKCLVTPNSRFDRFLNGDKTSLTPDEIEGYELFKLNKCATCHGGENMGGYTFEYLGLADDYFGTRGIEEADNNGRFNVTKAEGDMHRFKTPTLRNVALTYPYMHDGSVQDLKEATQIMLQYQSGAKLTEREIDKVVAFLNTLTGEMPDLSRFKK